MKEKILFSETDINKRVTQLGKIISQEYQGKDLVIIALLRGAYMFAADLTRHIEMPVCVDFMTTSSYENSEKSNGEVVILTDIRADIAGKDILIVDDIIDTGFTLEKIKEHLALKNPCSIKVCTMLNKASRRLVDMQPDYVGFEIEDVFVVGYGLDYKSYYRNVPYIFTWVH